MTSATEQRDPVEELAEEFLARRRAGESPTVAEYQAKHPDLSDRIQEVFQTLLLLEDMGGRSEGLDAVAEATALPGGRIGEYRILREIGRGGMGVVYQAIQESLDRQVALKIMTASPRLAGDYLERFQREARTAGRLHHTNIVPVFGVGADKGVHFFAMQFIEGRGLDRVLGDLRTHGTTRTSELPTRVPSGATTRVGIHAEAATEPQNAVPANGALPQANASTSAMGLQPGTTEYYRWVARLVADAADALAYAHKQGVVHRDIKPANLLLDDADSIWITDFGLARLDDADDLTATGQIVGTVRYMAPERFSGSSEPSVDVYALGMTLYELLTQRPAFDETNKAVLVDAIRRVEPQAPRALDRRVPRDLDTIALKAIAKETDRRYASAQAMADDLHRYRSGMPIAARRSGPVDRLLRWRRRHPVEAGLVLALFVALALGLAVSTSLYWRSEVHRRQAVDNLEKARAANALAESRLVEVNEQRAIADRNLKEALAAVDEYFTKTSDNKLLQTPGTQPLRRELLESALKYYRDFAKQQAGAPEFETEVGIAYYRAGLIVTQIAKREEALDLFQKSIAALEPVVARAWTPRANGALAASLNHLGLTLIQVKRVPEAIVALDRAVAMHEAAAAKAPKDKAARHNVAQSCINSGNAIVNAGRLADALERFRKGEALASQLVRDFPTDAAVRQTQIIGITNVASAEFRLGRMASALAGYKRALELQEMLAAESPKDMQLQREVARALNNLGTYYAQVERKPEALAVLQRASEILDRVVAANPEVALYRSGYVHSLSMFASVLNESGKPSEALAPAARAVEQVGQLVQRDPASLPLKQQLSNTQTKYAVVQDAAGKMSEALVTLAAAEDVLNKVDPARKLPDTCAGLGEVYQNRARTLDRMGRSNEAIAAAKQAVAMHKRAFAGNKSNFVMVNLYSTYMLIAKIERNRERWDASLEGARQALAIHDGTALGKIMPARHIARTADAMEAAVKRKRSIDGEKIEAFRKEAIDLIKQAVDQGYGPKLPADEAFASLRNRPDFKALLLP